MTQQGALGPTQRTGRARVMRPMKLAETSPTLFNATHLATTHA